MKEINVLSWGAGTQSTAMLLMMLELGHKIDYIIFADTKDENAMIYKQIKSIKAFVKSKYNRDIIVTSKNKAHATDEQIVNMILRGKIKSLRSSPYADLYQEQKLFYSNKINRATVVPFWITDRKTGELSKLPGRQCTVDYKISEIYKEIRRREGINKFNRSKHKVNMYIGFTVDEIARVKPNPLSYAENLYPLIDRGITKIDCIQYVKKKLGFKPVSSACNICFALNFDQVYEIYANDKQSWQRLLDLDAAMESYNHSKIRGDVWMYHWQAKIMKRLKDIDMDAIYNDRNQYHQLSIFDMFEDHEQMSCSGGCFI